MGGNQSLNRYRGCQRIAKNLGDKCGSVKFNRCLCKLLADIYSGSIANLDDNYLQQDEDDSSPLIQCDEAVAEMTRVMLCGQILVTDWSKQEWWKSVIHSSDCRSVKIRLILHLKEFLSCVKAFKIRVAEHSGKDDTLLSHLSEKDDLEYWMLSVEKASKIDSNSLLEIAKMFSGKGVFREQSQTRKIANHLLAMLTVSTSDGEDHDRHSIRYDDVQICTDKCLGQGGFGTVFKCTFLGMPAAAKVLKGADHAVSEGVKKEATILAKLQHPNVLQFIGVASNENQHVIVTELMDMDLLTYLQNSIPESDLSNSREEPPLKLLEAIDIMLQVAEGMDHLHREGVIHRDLKAKNVLVNVLDFNAMDGSRIRVSKSVRVKVADFGLSKLKDMSSNFTTLGLGTTPWRAPEVFEGNRERYKKSADVYSFAMLFFEVLTGKTPFDDLPRMTLYQSICEGVRPPLPSKTYCPDYLSELIRRCWATRAEDRPEFPEICQMLQYCKGILVRQEFPSHKKCIREYDAQESKGLTGYFQTTPKFKSKRNTMECHQPVLSIEVGSSHLWSAQEHQVTGGPKIFFNTITGVIAYNWALDKRLEDLRHHNVFLSDSYQESWNQAMDPSSLVEQPNFYVHVPAHIDQSAAPADGDAITILLPVANMGESYNGDLARCDKQIVDAGRVAILKRLKDAGVGDLTPHILREVIYSPPTWQKMYNLQYGAAFGLSHDLLQLAYFRPDVAPHSIRGLYFVGASTQPGNGVSLVLMGAKITGNRVIEDHHHDVLSSSSR